MRSSTLLSGILHCAVIAFVLLMTSGTNAPIPAARKPVSLVFPALDKYHPPIPRDSGRGGGGTRSETPPSERRLPKPAPRQFTPPVVELRRVNPLLPMEPAIVTDMELSQINLPRDGLPGGIPGPPSGGRGSGGGIGDGDGSGVGSRNGGGVSGEGPTTPPVVLYKVEPEYTEEAQKVRLQGTVVLAIEVDENGQVRNLRVREGLGLGLDERAIETVRRWKFRAGSRNGKPVPTSAAVYITFRLL